MSDLYFFSIEQCAMCRNVWLSLFFSFFFFLKIFFFSWETKSCWLVIWSCWVALKKTLLELKENEHLFLCWIGTCFFLGRKLGHWGTDVFSWCPDNMINWIVFFFGQNWIVKNQLKEWQISCLLYDNAHIVLTALGDTPGHCSNFEF